MIKYIKIICILFFFSAFGYSIYMNIKLNDQMRKLEFLQLRFPDETIPALNGYDLLNEQLKNKISFRDITICNLKDDLKDFNIDFQKIAEEILYLKSSRESLINRINDKKDNLSSYLEKAGDVDCKSLDRELMKK